MGGAVPVEVEREWLANLGVGLEVFNDFLGDVLFKVGVVGGHAVVVADDFGDASNAGAYDVAAAGESFDD